MSFQEVPGSVTLTGQTGSVATSTLFNTGPLGAGMYVVFIDVITTTAGSAGTVSVGVTWNNGVTSSGFDSSAFSLSTSDEQSEMLGNFYSIASSPITYTTTVTGAVGNPVYTARLRLLYLG